MAKDLQGVSMNIIEREQLLDRIHNTADKNLCYLIKEVYERCKSEKDTFLRT